MPKVVDKPVEPEIQSPRRPAVPPPQPPISKAPVSILFLKFSIFHSFQFIYQTFLVYRKLIFDKLFLFIF